MTRRFAILSARPHAVSQGLEGDSAAVRGEVMRDGPTLIEAVNALPADHCNVYVCLETGHVFSRVGNDREYHGTLMDILGYHKIAHGYVHASIQELVLTPGDMPSARAALSRAMPLCERRIREILEWRSSLPMTRPRFIKLLVASLALVGERAADGGTVLTHQAIFKTIAVADQMVMG